MDYRFEFEFTCECGRKHKLRLTRDGMEKVDASVDRSFHNVMNGIARAVADIDGRSPQTIQPTQPGPDTIRNS